MISIQHEGTALIVAVFGEFTLSDYREFEENVLHDIRFQGQVDVLFNLNDMLSYTLDVAWEEIRFSRAHARDFRRIAVITNDEWMTWATWVARFFVDADVQVFAEESEARGWLELPVAG